MFFRDQLVEFSRFSLIATPSKSTAAHEMRFREFENYRKIMAWRRRLSDGEMKILELKSLSCSQPPGGPPHYACFWLSCGCNNSVFQWRKGALFCTISISTARPALLVMMLGFFFSLSLHLYMELLTMKYSRQRL